MKEYKDWLKNPDYKKGVELYTKSGKSNAAILAILSLSETSFTRKKLEDALEGIFGQKVETSTEKDDTHPKTPKVVLDLIRKRSQLHELLFHTNSKSDRHTIAMAILAIGKKLDRYYDHGELPEDQAENRLPEGDIPTNAWDLHMMLNNNAAYITKNKNREDKQGEVKRRERQSSLIEERLKSLNYEQSIS